jgi:type I restriction enzyme S subunit
MVLAAEMQSAKRPLPPGWRWVRLGDVAEYLNGRAFKPEEWGKAGLPIIRIENLNSPTALFNSFEGRVDPRNMVNDGDLLISWSASLDAYNWSGGPAVLNQHIFKVEEKREFITREYLYFAARLAMREIRLQVHGATMRHITKPEFEAIQIPLPPLEEQKRIAMILNEQMSVVARARAAAEAQLEAAKAIPAAYLRAVFSSPEARLWTQRPLGGLLVEPLKTGISKPTLAGAEKFCLTLSAVRNGLLDLAARKPVDVTDSEAEGNWVRGGAFYVVRGNGNPSLLGRGALSPSLITTPVLYPDLLIQVILDPALVASEYLRFAWDNEETREDIERRSRTSAGIYKINQANLASVTIPVPSLVEQQRIAGMLNEQMASAERARKAVEEELDAIKKLPAGLLHRAFSGEF